MRFHCANGLGDAALFRTLEAGADPANNVRVGYFSGSQFHNGFVL